MWRIDTNEPSVYPELPWGDTSSLNNKYAPHFAGLRNAASVVINDCWVILGGSIPPEIRDPYGHKLLDTVHCYSPLTRSWTSWPSLSSHRESMGAVVLHSKIYVAGGVVTRMEASGVVATFECFDTESMRWSRLADLPSRRHSFGMAALPPSSSSGSGDIVILGGEEYSTPVTFTCYRYNIGTKQWLPWINLPAVSGSFESLLIDYERTLMIVSRYGCWTLDLEKHRHHMPTSTPPNGHTITWLPLHDIVEYGCDSAIVAL
jgi:hypothetical protein